jgi:hypothetical protein
VCCLARFPHSYNVHASIPDVFYCFAFLQKPKGIVSLANLKCRLPKSERKIKDEDGNEIGNCAFRADIDGAPEGHNKFIFATETAEDLIRTFMPVCFLLMSLQLVRQFGFRDKQVHGCCGKWCG